MRRSVLWRHLPGPDGRYSLVLRASSSTKTWMEGFGDPVEPSLDLCHGTVSTTRTALHGGSGRAQDEDMFPFRVARNGEMDSKGIAGPRNPRDHRRPRRDLARSARPLPARCYTSPYRRHLLHFGSTRRSTRSTLRRPLGSSRNRQQSHRRRHEAHSGRMRQARPRRPRR